MGNKPGEVIVYVMSRDQRINDNHALLFAQKEALNRELPLLIVFNLYAKSGLRAREHYEFMLEGLNQLQKDAANKNIPFIILGGEPYDSTINLLRSLNAYSVYFDFSPLRGPQKLTKKVAKNFDGTSYVVDTHNIIPAWIVSDKQEYAAHTIRRKIHRLLEEFLEEPAELINHPHNLKTIPESLSAQVIDNILSKVSKSGIEVEKESGEVCARNQLRLFLGNGLEQYSLGRNDISSDQQSGLSAFLHYGQISSLRVTLEIMKVVDEPPLLIAQSKMPQPGGSSAKVDGMNSLLEELIVRKELSDNFCFYNSNYDNLQGGPQWALRDLAIHQDDSREFTYSKSQFERSETHDELWNAAQLQLTRSGNIHGYMRMYWAKKILEWSISPAEAVRTAIYLNDHYSIDGGDPNGYVGILWSITGLHDRPWFEREIYGKVRYMTASGIAKKYDVAAYINQNS